MALSFKMAASLVAVVLLLLATPIVRGSALDDMVPVQMPAKQLAVAISGAAATIMAGSPSCLQCRCCSRSSPGTCVTTTCCSSFKCDSGGRCNLVQEKCGCSGCGNSN
ncbi:uncharacterized protein [Zea mays]|uniref:Uncharacterized protein n=1 Tax=Zea mays TaxID=4577 RepID=A0A1D6EXS7_MAIZE|nr:uncharacterized protein LOC103647739 [Zea mays]ONM24240.1 hypothetical protein ZEAMMB73_Zm00001d006556 [Zea mays]|eukprot:XP_008670477.1 uncharacterized protein LOC103647739 [Zea mays]